MPATLGFPEFLLTPAEGEFELTLQPWLVNPFWDELGAARFRIAHTVVL